MSAMWPDAIPELKVTGEDGRHIKLSIRPALARDGSDQRSLYVTIKADNRAPLGFYIDEDDIALGTDDTLFMLVAWLARKVS